MDEYVIKENLGVEIFNSKTGEKVENTEPEPKVLVDTKDLRPADWSDLPTPTSLEEIKKHEHIYARMYGYKYIDNELDKIIEINTDELKNWVNGKSFYYIWGWPGPDYNVYHLKDYGETWAYHPWEMEGKY